MSVMRLYVVACDHPDCGLEPDHLAPTLREARMVARQQGFASSPSGDYCPEHIPA